MSDQARSAAGLRMDGAATAEFRRPLTHGVNAYACALIDGKPMPIVSYFEAQLGLTVRADERQTNVTGPRTSVPYHIRHGFLRDAIGGHFHRGR